MRKHTALFTQATTRFISVEKIKPKTKKALPQDSTIRGLKASETRRARKGKADFGNKAKSAYSGNQYEQVEGGK